MRTWALVWLGVMLAACGQRPAAVGTVDRLDTHIAVTHEGHLDVRDVFTLSPDASGTIAFHHTLESAYADGVAFDTASIDGRPIESGTNGLLVDARSDRISVSWRSTSSNTSVRLALVYRVTAAVAVLEPRGRIEWPVLAAGRGFDAGNVVIDLELPEDVRTYDGTGMAESGWHVELTPRGMTARRDDVLDRESATLLAVFDIDRSRVAQPRWEWNQDRGRQFFLALLSAGGFILIVGVGILVQMRVQYPPAPADASSDALDASRATRRSLSRGLRIAGWVALLFAVACAIVAQVFLRGFGLAVQAIPGSTAIVGVMFLLSAWWYGRKL